MLSRRGFLSRLARGAASVAALGPLALSSAGETRSVDSSATEFIWIPSAPTLRNPAVVGEGGCVYFLHGTGHDLSSRGTLVKVCR